jgi:Tol biopolymer transport system component/tRNA A-37 threonylcarbamoyl transferase component Bud32
MTPGRDDHDGKDRIPGTGTRLSLAVGSRLGPYEVLSPLGAGGMGEVYRARDTRLGREVAIKVLPSHLSNDPDLKARFEREARAISQLTHPHICTLHDVGSENGIDFLVMELLDGQSLADRLEKGPLAPDQVLRLGIEIADALDRAHRAGIVHRDLKPGNIMLTKSGVKLLDFGLAKMAAAEKPAADLSSLPTNAPSQPLTERGTVMGTFQYMAPEQLEGKTADARSDLFSFGCVLYEMSTGRKAFSGTSQASLVTAIMSKEPEPISAIAPMAPPALDRLVATCLAKDPEERWQSARDVKNELSWIARAGSQAGAPAVVVSKRKNRERLAWVVAAATTLAAAGLLLTRPAARKDERIQRFSMAPPDKAAFGLTHAISPDGRWIVFSAGIDGPPRLYLRALDAFEPRPLAGTDEAGFPFWSPDSRFVAFFADGRLRKLDIASGSIQTICDAPQARGGSWGGDGTILFAPDLGTGLFRVSAAGGAPVAMTSPDRARGETSHRFPHFLPDGRHFLYYARTSGSEKEWVYSASLDSKEGRPLLQAASSVFYSPDGYLLFVREGTLLAQPFDASRLRLSGEPVPVAESMNYLGSSVPDGYAAFSAAKGGFLTYRSNTSSTVRLGWFDRSGKLVEAVGPEGFYDDPALSRDGSRVVVDITNPKAPQEGTNLWILELSRGTFSRLTFGGGISAVGVWSPDGSEIVFARQKKVGIDLYRVSSTGSSPEVPLVVTDAFKSPDDWSRDGRYLIYETADPKTKLDLWVVPMKEGGKPFPYVQAAFDQAHAQFSPDGRFVAYTSSESGRDEVYVQTFPKLTGKWQISTGGGDQAYWRADGRELFYLRPDRTLMAVAVKAEAGFQASLPVALFATRTQTVAIGSSRAHYAVANDGQRFLVNSILDRANFAPIQVVLNWTAAVKRP